ncbi:unnamed protein product, partial [marine sediment metagenome]
MLEGVGFDFYPDETAWDKMLADLKVYKSKHGD